MPNPQHAILTNLTKYQWYTHLSRTEGADLGVIKQALRELRTFGQDVGVTKAVNVCVLFGPTLLADLTDDVPEDFQPYPGYSSPDGSKIAKGTQEELLVWIHSEDKDLCWEAQFNFRNAVAGHMTVARETPTFIYRNSLDLTGFIDGTGNPEPEFQHDRGIVPDGKPGAGGAFCIAQRWVHDLKFFNGLPLEDQENTFGRTKVDSTKLPVQVPKSHLKHVELREGETADEATPKRGEMVRRSTPYAFHDGTVGLYFMGFCREQAPMRERMEAMYGNNGHVPDAITDYSTPASGAFYFAPSIETLEGILA
jgi:putative iron-dependent peroxidase